MKSQFKQFCLRWLACSIALGIGAKMFSTIELEGGKVSALIIAGGVLALVNSVLKPLVTVLSLPAILVSLGLFSVLINGFMVVVAAWLYGPLKIDTFGAAVVVGILVGVTNFCITRLVDSWRSNK